MGLKLSKWLAAVAAIPVIIAILLLSGLTIPLDFLDSRLESLAAEILGRNVTIQGPVRLTPSLQPRLELGGVTIGNPRDWADEYGYFLKVEESRAQLSLTELLQGKLHIKDLEFSGVNLQFITRANHTNNFQFAMQDSGRPPKATKHELSSLDRLRLLDLRVSYIDELSKKQYILEIAEAYGQGQPESPLQFMFSGKLGNKPFTLDVTGGTLQELLNKDERWLLTEGRLHLAELSFDLSGSLDPANKGVAAYMALALEGKSLDAFGNVFDLSLPDIGDFSLKTRITFQPGMLQFTTTQLNASGNTLEGEFLVDLSGNRPKLSGNIATVELTPEIINAFRPDDSEKPVKDEPESAISAELPWEIFRLVDTDLQVHAGSIQLGEIRIDDLNGTLSLVDGDLVVPLSMTIMDLPLNGQFEIATSSKTPEISADISTPGASLDHLFEVVSADHTLQGQLGIVSFRSKSAGEALDELIKKADFELLLGPTTIKRDSSVIVATETFSLQRSHQRSFSFSATGELLGSPMNLSTVLAKPDEPSRFTGSALHLDLRACDTELLFDGGITKKATGERSFSMKVAGEKLCGLLEPVEYFMGKNFSFATTAAGRLNDDGLKIDVENITLGELSLNGWIKLLSGENGTPFVSGVVHSERLDLANILHQRNSDAPESVSQTSPQPGKEPVPSAQTAFEQKIALIKDLLALDILPIKKFLTTDVHLEIELEELITELMSVDDIKLFIDAEKGKLKHSPFQARIGDSLFTGSASVDMTTTVPMAHLELITDDFNLSELLRDFNISQVPDITAEHVGFDLSFTGKTVQDMFLQANYLAELRNGRAVLPRELQAPLVLNLTHVDYVAAPGQPAMMLVDGDINDLPLALKMTGDGVFAKGSEKPAVIALQAELVDTWLEIDGQVNRKKDMEESFRLSTILSGTRMDSLNELLGVNMPPLGPYQIKGSLASKKDNHIGLYDMAVQLGDSKLHGEVILSAPPNEAGKPEQNPFLQARLNAQSIQLNDFQFKGWSPLIGDTEDSENTEQKESGKDQNNKRLYNIIDAELVQAINGVLDVQVKEVLSGQDNLGNGQLNVRLDKGHYIMDGLRLDIPGGTITIEGMLQPEQDRISAELQMTVKQFDYGILARRKQPDSSLKGEVNLILDLSSRAETPNQLGENVNGRIRIGIVPKEHKAKTLDLWAVNIITAALPALLKGNESVVNCLAGDFILEDGILQPDVFTLDTSKMRVQGKGMVNFKTNEIDFHLKPTPKSAQFFSLATPISVSGSIMKPDIGVTTADVFSTVFRQAISVVTVPIQWLFTDNLEADGTKVCSAIMQWVDEGSHKPQK